MGQTNSASEALTAFFDEIGPFYKGYKSATISYLGRVTPITGVVRILKMNVRLQPLSPPLPKLAFSSKSVVAGTLVVTGGIQQFMERLLTGEEYDTGDGKFQFNASPTAPHTFFEFDEAASSAGNRLVTATILGIGQTTIPQPVTDWALRAHSTPYNGITDLSADYGFGEAAETPSIVLEAYQVGFVDAASIVQGTQASVGVRLAKGLDSKLVTVGIKIISDDGQKIERTMLKGDAMRWGVDPKNVEVLCGQSTITVPDNALLHCFLAYDGAPLHSYWLHDTKVIPNSLRLVLDTFDEGLDRIRKGFSPVAINKRNQDVAGNFEHSCAALLWMLGFSVFKLERKEMGNAVDILARSNMGNFLLIECTTGPLKADKRANLVKRAAEIKASLARSWQQHVRVIPVMATSEKRELIGVDVSDLRKEGIVGCAHEDLIELLDNRTLFPQNSDALFAQLEALLNSGTATN